ncbi:MAG: hypothetical protein HYZ44_03635 [Bacteroidetes bacterium]|nr:hypothetical protein [Bacteroidota bacterium]
MRAIILTTAFLFSFAGLAAKDVLNQKLNWGVTHLKDIAKDTVTSYQCSFITNGDRNISWVQDEGDFVTTLRVNSMEGQWTNVASPGKVTYSISVDSQSGILIFERDQSGLWVTLDLTLDSGIRIHHQYTVSQVAIN